MPRGMYVAKMGSAPTFQINERVAAGTLRSSECDSAGSWRRSQQIGAGDLPECAKACCSQAENYQTRKAGSKPVMMTAREAAQKAEDSRIITMRREREIAMKNAKDAAAKSKADAEEAAGQRR